MKIPEKTWVDYINRLSRIDKTATDKMIAYMNRVPGILSMDPDALIEFAYGVSTKYGEAAAALACEMYEAVAEASGVTIETAVPAETAGYGEVAKAVSGTAKTGNIETVAGAVGRLVKRAGVDTTMKNAIRDGAEWAWIPHGDTCAFCLTLASRGWQKASEKALKGGHAEHIHSHCDCTYEVRFNEDTQYEGYDPDQYLEMYESAEGNTSAEKINSMRRAQYARDKDKINAQKRKAYAARKGLTTYEGIPKSWNNIGIQSTDEALKACNPHYKQELPDSLYGTKDDYTNNCANSIVAFEMRKRGYSVTACSLGENKKLKNEPFSAWIGRTPEKTKGSGLEDILSFMDKEEDGTRIEIAICYKNQKKGHTFISEKRNGEIIFLDPQRNRIINENFFTKAEYNATMFMKINDLEISDRGVSACKKE